MRRVAQLITYTRLACGSDACILGLTLLLSSPHLFPCLFPFHVALVHTKGFRMRELQLLAPLAKVLRVKLQSQRIVGFARRDC